VSSALIAAIDLLPTLASACGIDLQSLKNGYPEIDGVNVMDTLFAKPKAIHPRKDLLYWHGSEGFQAIRTGRWKLFPIAENAGLTDGKQGAALFDLLNDPGEENNISHRYPERVRMMQALANERLKDIADNSIDLAVE
jgi:arylsulfatase A-like enzyme